MKEEKKITLHELGTKATPKLKGMKHSNFNETTVSELRISKGM